MYITREENEGGNLRKIFLHITGMVFIPKQKCDVIFWPTFWTQEEIKEKQDDENLQERETVSISILLQISGMIFIPT